MGWELEWGISAVTRFANGEVTREGIEHMAKAGKKR